MVKHLEITSFTHTLGTGYRFDFATNISATPFVAGHYQSVTMKNYSEKGAAGQKTSTQMDFNIPKENPSWVKLV